MRVESITGCGERHLDCEAAVALMRSAENDRGGCDMADQQETLWFGYLEAGEKGSAVVRDVTLGTANPATFYLFNLKRGKILEYKRNIAEPKLRELTDEEKESIEEFRQAFEQAERVSLRERRAS